MHIFRIWSSAISPENSYYVAFLELKKSANLLEFRQNYLLKLLFIKLLFFEIFCKNKSENRDEVKWELRKNVLKFNAVFIFSDAKLWIFFHILKI